MLATAGRVRHVLRGSGNPGDARTATLGAPGIWERARRGRAGSRCFRPRSPATRRAPVGRPNCARTNNWWRARSRRAQCTRTVRPNRASGPPDSFHTTPPGRRRCPAAGEAEWDKCARPVSFSPELHWAHAAQSCDPEAGDAKAANGQAPSDARHIKLGGAGRGRKQRLKSKGTWHLLLRYFERPYPIPQRHPPIPITHAT